MGIYNGAGQLRAHYEYDAWGNILSVTDENGNAITGATHIGNLNPFRYRGYYYDTESGFYYLMSRYYDPVTHRFVNADGYFQSGGDILDANMSAYCRNNPINCYDPTGTMAKTLRELQNDLLWEDNLKYDITDITKAQKAGYGMNDRFSVYDSGGLYYDYSVGDKLLDSLGAIFYSLEVDTDIGVGCGVGIESIGSIEAGAKYALAFHFDESGVMFGDIKSIESSGGVMGWDFVQFGDAIFYDYITQQEFESFGGSNKIGLSFSGYCGFGASISFGWNLDYVINRFCEIWS